MMSASKEFVKAECSASLKRALKSRIHPKGDNIQEGDMIYHNNKRGIEAEVEWKGPWKVVAINGKKLFIDNGARLATINRDDIVRIGQEFWRMDDLPDQNNSKQG